MATYVDRATWRKSKAGPRSPNYCHLTADTIDELHAMARLVGLKSGFQRYSYPHYDLTETRRALAVGAGALEITSKQLLLKAKFLAQALEDKMAKDAKARSPRKVPQEAKRR